VSPSRIIEFAYLALALAFAFAPAAFAAFAAEEVRPCALALALGHVLAATFGGAGCSFMAFPATVAAGGARAGFACALGRGAQELRVAFT